MAISYTDRVKRERSDYDLAMRASVKLEDVLGEDAPIVTGEWDRSEDEQGQPLIALRLTDLVGQSVLGEISPNELQSPTKTAIYLHRLWGDLLHMQNVSRLQALIGAGD